MSAWFKIYKKTDNPRLRLFCFPYAGGGAHVFSRWAESITTGVDVFAIQAPGRERRFSEQPIASLATQVRLLHSEILPFIDVPYVFIGHSNGALLAYELARELQKSGNCNLQHMIISAKRAPHLPDIKPNIHDLSQADFLRELKAYDFTPDEVLENDELMEIFSPMLRADFALSETHDFNPAVKLNSNATVFWGNLDKDVPFPDIQAWQDLVDGDIDFIEFNDGHFFITNNREQYIDQVNRVLQKGH